MKSDCALPEGWTMRRLGDVCSEVVRRAGDQCDLPVLSVSKVLGIVPQTEKFGKRIASKNVHNYKRVRRGEFAFDPMLLWDGSIARQDAVDEGLVSPAYCVFAADKSVHTSYLSILLRSPWAISRFGLVSVGTNLRRRKAHFADFARIRLPFPPWDEQVRSAATISALQDTILRTEATARQLRRVRNALLTVALDRTMDSAGSAMRITAIGPIPESWQARRVAEVLAAPMQNGRCPAKADNGPTQDLLILSAIADGQVIPDGNLKPIHLTLQEAERNSLRRDDVMIVRGSGSKHLVARAGLVREPVPACVFPDTMIRVRLRNETVDPAFFTLVWNSTIVRKQVMAVAKTTNSTWKVGQHDISEMIIPVPPIEVQKGVCQWAGVIDELVSLETDRLSGLRSLEKGLRQVLTGC